MNPRILMASLLGIMLVQISTYPPVHGFPPGTWLLLLLEGALIPVLLGMTGAPGFLPGLLACFWVWRFWSFLVPVSWAGSWFIHAGAGYLARACIPDWGYAAEGFRVAGSMVAADPSKTAAFPLTVILALFFFFVLIEDGLLPALSRMFGTALWCGCWAIGRWLVLAGVLGWGSIDLVRWAWDLFWGVGLLLSLLPLAWCPNFARREGIWTRSAGLRRQAPRVLIGWMGCLLMLAVLHLTQNALWERGTPRILIDESHSRWEPVCPTPRRAPGEVAAVDTATVDTAAVSTVAENNYYAFVRSLERLGSVTILFDPKSPAQVLPFQAGWEAVSPLTSEILDPERYDLFVVKCPTASFSETEISVVRDFVSGGGSLLAIGEHTDFSFVNSHLNRLLDWAGTTFRSDGVCDHQGRWLVTGGNLHSPLPFSPGAGPFMWATGASVRGGPDFLPLAVSSPDAFSDPWNPANPSFFGNLAPRADHLYGPFILNGFVPFGRGNVFVHGDSTNFNATMMSTPGKREWIRRLIRRGHVPGHAVVVQVLVEILFAVLSGLTLGILRFRHRLIAAGFLVGTLILVYPGGGLAGRQGIDLPAPGEKPTLALDYSLRPAIPLSYGHQQAITGPGSLDPLIIDLTNRGVVPYPTLGPLDQALDGRPDALLLAAPGIQPDAGTLARLRRWVEAGGQLILVFPGDAAGPGRGILLANGWRESGRNVSPGGFPSLVRPGALCLKAADGLPLVISQVGGGWICLLEGWSGLPPGRETSSHLADLLAGNGEFPPEVAAGP